MKSVPTKSAKRKRDAPAESSAPAGEPAGVPVTLPSHCSVKDAADLKMTLCAFASEPRCVTLDLGNVERIDTAVMQLLCAFMRERRGHGRAVAWQGDSAAVREAARLLGVEPILDLPAPATVAA